MSKLHPAWDKRRKLGDRFDGTLIKELDPMHVIMPIIYPNRCDNEAFFRATVDITAIRAYVNAKNQCEPEVPYTVFQVMVACIMKLFYLRPKMNRFIANRLMYQRNEVTSSFTVKKVFADDGAEALTIVNAEPNDTIEDIHQKVAEQITTSRSDKIDKSSESMAFFSKMPRRLMRAVCRPICWLEKVGHCPKGLIDTDPFYTSALIANLGSIGIDAGYHHLSNWGTTSVFVVIGKIRKEEVVADDGTTELHELVELGLTIDERLADGYYYAKSLACLKELIAHPELLEQPMSAPLPQ